MAIHFSQDERTDLRQEQEQLADIVKPFVDFPN